MNASLISGPRPVLLDTNFLLLPFQFKINILDDLEYLVEQSHRFVVSSCTISELQDIGAHVGKHGMAARLALKLVEANRHRIDVVQSTQTVDDWIVDYAAKHNAIACTNDSKLRRRLKKQGVAVVSMKSRSKLGFV